MNSILAGGEELKLPPMHHLVRVAIPQGMEIAREVRLNERNEIDCISCHGIEDIADTPLDEVDREAPDFFVGGPYPANQLMGAFCARCHDRKTGERTNIHILLDEDGKLIEQRCSYCHLEVPDTELAVAEGQINESAGLRLPAGKICFGCHLMTPHLNAANHLIEMPEKMIEQLKREAATGSMPSGGISPSLDKVEKRGYRLPLSDGHITCITCHSPHQRGVIKRHKGEPEQVEDRPLEEGIGYADHSWNQVVAADKTERIDELLAIPVERSALKDRLKYQRLTHEVLLRAPAKDGTLCLLCHKFENERIN